MSLFFYSTHICIFSPFFLCFRPTLPIYNNFFFLLPHHIFKFASLNNSETRNILIQISRERIEKF